MLELLDLPLSCVVGISGGLHIRSLRLMIRVEDQIAILLTQLINFPLQLLNRVILDIELSLQLSRLKLSHLLFLLEL